MNKDTALDLALEAGFADEKGTIHAAYQLKAFEALVRADEREACAKVCEDINAKYEWPDDVAERVASQWCADAIRARGNT
jgi:hypothetical protein